MSEANLAGSKLLTSWKEIAAFLGKGVRTVQRWEATLGLPILRPDGAPRNVVMAHRDDLEAWVQRGRRAFRPQANASLKKDEEARLQLAAGLEEFRRAMKEIEGLVQDVAISRAVLREEVRRFRSLYDEWNMNRNCGGDADYKPLHASKVN